MRYTRSPAALSVSITFRPRRLRSRPEIAPRTECGCQPVGSNSCRLVAQADVLKPYKATIDRGRWPDVFKNQDTSVAKAKEAIADYRRAVGQPEGLAEMMVFCCERAVGFSNDVGLHDESYFDVLVRMFDQACKAVGALPEERKVELWVRLDAVRRLGHNLSYGVGDDMDDLLAEHGFDGGPR